MQTLVRSLNWSVLVIISFACQSDGVATDTTIAPTPTPTPSCIVLGEHVHQNYSANAFTRKSQQMPPAPGTNGVDLSTGPFLRVYRLAVATTGEWTAINGGTVSNAMASISSLVSRVNAIYEREFAVRFELVPNNDRLIFTDPATDPYTTFDPVELAVLLNQNQAVLDGVIGTANYDLGILFFKGDFGVAGHLDGVCNDAVKGKCAIGFQIQPDGRNLGLILHELGHMFGVRHTYSGLSCDDGQFSAETAYEPGSGSTIMGFAGGGGCQAPDYMQSHTGLYFHSGAYDVIVSNLLYGSSSKCPKLIPTGNHPPVISAGGPFTIPGRTPFTLTATSSDADGDALTYCWEQRDLGPRQRLSEPDNGASPLFRSFPPTPDPSRTFPQWADILNHRKTPGEQLPTTSRILHFRVTARDNRFGGGGVSRADTAVTVVSSAGPFVVAEPMPNTVWSGVQSVLWDVAGTTNAPISASSVNILLSTNGGLTFPIVLAANTPNDGGEAVPLPDIYTTEARLKIEAVGNVFFAVSKGNFTIRPTTPWFMVSSSALVSENAQPANGMIDPGETVTMQFVFQNVGMTESVNPVVRLISDSNLVAPSAPQTSSNLDANAFLTNSFSFTAPTNAQAGKEIGAQLEVSGEGLQPRTFIFPLRIGRTTTEVASFTNGASIVLNGGGAAANPNYPSFLKVSGLAGKVSKVTAHLANLNHTWAPILDVLLVGPEGQSVVLMSDTGFLGGASGVSLVFDDNASRELPGMGDISSGTFKPTNLPPDDVFYSPAPTGPYSSALSVFKGTNPNGYWRLFAMNAHSAYTGTIGRWSLSITTECCDATVVDPTPVQPALSIADATLIEADSGTKNVLVEVRLSGPSDKVVSATFTTVDGTATASSDFTMTSGIITFNPGEAFKTISIPVVADVAAEDSETFSVRLDRAENASISRDLGVVTIQDNDSVRVNANNARVMEGNTGQTNLEFTVTLSKSHALPVVVHYATADATATNRLDYMAVSGDLTFAPGESNKTVAVPILGDALSESFTHEFFGTLTKKQETVVLRLSQPVNAILGLATGFGSIIDDDPLPQVSIANETSALGSTGNSISNVLFTVTLSAPRGQPTKVDYTTVNQTAIVGVDFVATTGTLKFVPGTTQMTISVPVIGSSSASTDKTFLVRLRNPIDATLATREASGTIRSFENIQFVRVLFLDRGLQLGFTTRPGRRYRIERTDDLSRGIWTPLVGTENILGTGKVVEITDAGVASQAHQFYRVEELR